MDPAAPDGPSRPRPVVNGFFIPGLSYLDKVTVKESGRGVPGLQRDREDLLLLCRMGQQKVHP